MKLYDKSTQDLAQAVQDVLEGKVKKEEAKYPHDMFHPKTGEKEVAKNEAEHKALAAKGYTHDKPEENVAGPADLSVDQNMKKVKDKHGKVDKVDKAGLKEDIDAAHDEALAIEEARKVEAKDEDEEDSTEEESDKQAKYKAFFAKALKKFGADSPSELKGDKKKEFFDYVDANYEADNEAD